jgi:hypothetical protein
MSFIEYLNAYYYNIITGGESWTWNHGEHARTPFFFDLMNVRVANAWN